MLCVRFLKSTYFGPEIGEIASGAVVVIDGLEVEIKSAIERDCAEIIVDGVPTHFPRVRKLELWTRETIVRRFRGRNGEIEKLARKLSLSVPPSQLGDRSWEDLAIDQLLERENVKVQRRIDQRALAREWLQQEPSRAAIKKRAEAQAALAEAERLEAEAQKVSEVRTYESALREYEIRLSTLRAFESVNDARADTERERVVAAEAKLAEAKLEHDRYQARAELDRAVRHAEEVSDDIDRKYTVRLTDGRIEHNTPTGEDRKQLDALRALVAEAQNAFKADEFERVHGLCPQIVNMAKPQIAAKGGGIGRVGGVVPVTGWT